MCGRDGLIAVWGLVKGLSQSIISGAVPLGDRPV